MPFLQEWIHRLEVGPWVRHLKTGLTVLVLFGLVLGYNWRSFRNFNTQEAMDSAQLARNLAQGKGYTTSFVRPFSLYLVKQRNAGSEDPARIKANHPDLANPPVYPLVLAGWMKIYTLCFRAADAVRNILPSAIQELLPDFHLEMDNPLWQNQKHFWWSPHDFMIACFNEVLFFIVIGLTYLLARRLFDPGVAWLSGVLLLGSELLWRFSVSGLSTILLMLIFVGLAWCLVLIEQEVREPKRGPGKLLVYAAGAGLLLGLGMLTRYSFGGLLLPVVAYLLLFGGARKAALGLLTVGIFLLVVSPWIYRNLQVSGLPFGTATLAVREGTFAFPEHELARSLAPDLNQNFFGALQPKFFGNARVLLQNDLPKLGGSWLTALFLAGLLLGFRNPGIRRLRYFLMMSLATFFVAQALGRTQLTEDSPDLNSENLLVLLVPLVFVFGVSFFQLLLDQMNFVHLRMRSTVVGAFGCVMVLPMLLTFLPPRSNPTRFPPYYPPAIQTVSSWMKENELMMSDVPWAVAWYGQRQCVWLTHDANESFYAVNDLLKPVRGLYLTAQTLDARFASQWIRPGADGWGNFLLVSIMVRKNFPATFPLREAAPGFLPEHLFLSDRNRWDNEAPAATPDPKPATTEQPAAPETPSK